MKLSSITNKHPEGKWFEFAGLEVFLKYGEGLEAKVNMVIAKFVQRAAEAAESGDAEGLAEAEKQAKLSTAAAIAEDYFTDFRSLDEEGVLDDDGNALSNTLENRVMILSLSPVLYDFVDKMISNHEYWVD